ncbi:MAG TPA: ABC transporter permease [Aggregatilineales bacterium]|nr:ABC transporter permease [Aggregatilineales bacterium]
MRRFIREVKYLWLEQVFELRSYWPTLVGYSVVMPLMMIYGLSRIGGSPDDARTLARLIVGSVIFAVANEATSVMAIRVSTLLQDGTFVYYAALPIRKGTFITALILSRSFMVVPAALVPLAAGPAMYNLAFHYNFGLVAVMLLTILVFSVLGVLLGLTVSTVEIAQLGSSVVLLMLVLASPVFIAWDLLPGPLQAISLAMPFTYSADALGRALSGDLGQFFWLDLLVLIGAGMVGVAAVSRSLRRRAF